MRSSVTVWPGVACRGAADDGDASILLFPVCPTARRALADDVALTLPADRQYVRTRVHGTPVVCRITPTNKVRVITVYRDKPKP
jgi:hypothetical protein